MQFLIQINKYISIDLEGRNIIIYILKEKFKVYSLSKINEIIHKAKFLKNINIDNNIIKDILKRNPKNVDTFISFYKLLNFWAMNRYNTNIIDYQISLPILRKLYQIGDRQAEKLFHDEILKNLWGGDPSVIKFLMREKYHDYLLLESYKRRVNLVYTAKDIKFTLFICILMIGLYIFLPLFRFGDNFEFSLVDVFELNKSKIYNDLELWRLFTPIITHRYRITLVVNGSLILVFGSLFEVNNVFHLRNYFLVYILSGVIGNIFYLLLNPNPEIFASGASGTIFGIMGAFIIILLSKKRYFWAIIIFLISGLFLFVSYYPTIGYYAHLFGFITGIVINSLVHSLNSLKHRKTIKKS